MDASPTRLTRALVAARPVGVLPVVVLALGVTGAILLIVAELTTIARIDVLTTTCERSADIDVRDRCNSSGFDQHGGAFVLLGVVGIAMAFGAARGSSRPAAIALVVIALVVLAFAILRDIPDARETGLVGPLYDQAEAKAGTGLYLEVIGAGLMLVAGIAGLTRRGATSPPAGS